MTTALPVSGKKPLRADAGSGLLLHICSLPTGRGWNHGDSDLFQFLILIVDIITLVVLIYSSKK